MASQRSIGTFGKCLKLLLNYVELCESEVSFSKQAQ